MYAIRWGWTYACHLVYHHQSFLKLFTEPVGGRHLCLGERHPNLSCLNIAFGPHGLTFLPPYFPSPLKRVWSLATNTALWVPITGNFSFFRLSAEAFAPPPVVLWSSFPQPTMLFSSFQSSSGKSLFRLNAIYSQVVSLDQKTRSLVGGCAPVCFCHLH